MGMIITPTPIGDDCTRCYPPGETPSKLFVFFGGISMGSLWDVTDPTPPNDYFILEQQPGSPCFYALSTASLNITLLYNPSYSRLYCDSVGGSDVFYSELFSDCEKYFVNVYTEPPDRHFHSGFGYISTPEAIAAAVNSIVRVFEDGARFEVTPTAGGILNIRYANRKHRQNITVQVPAS